MHTLILEDGRALATWAQPIIEAERVVGIASVTADVSERQTRERELLAAINQEQRRFGRDLHDGLGQELTGIALLLRSLSSRAATRHVRWPPGSKRWLLMCVASIDLEHPDRR